MQRGAVKDKTPKGFGDFDNEAEARSLKRRESERQAVLTGCQQDRLVVGVHTSLLGSFERAVRDAAPRRGRRAALGGLLPEFAT